MEREISIKVFTSEENPLTLYIEAREKEREDIVLHTNRDGIGMLLDGRMIVKYTCKDKEELEDIFNWTTAKILKVFIGQIKPAEIKN